MKISRSLVFRILLIVFLILATLLIFKNSFEDNATSHEYSGTVLDVVAPNRDVTDYSGNSNLEKIIRKSAHIIEYATLGIVSMALALNTKSIFKNAGFGIAFFYVLFVAVLDEHIQGYMGRCGTTGDILLDFFGGIIGFAVVLLVCFVVAKIKKAGEKKASEI